MSPDEVTERVKVGQRWERRRAARHRRPCAHGRRDTNTYPPMPNTTGIIINIPNTVLIIVFSILCVLLSGTGSRFSGSVAAIRSAMTTLQRGRRGHHRPTGDL